MAKNNKENKTEEKLKELAKTGKNAVLIHKTLEELINDSTEEQISKNLGLLSIMELLFIKSNIENTKAAFNRSEKAITPLVSAMVSFGLGRASAGIDNAGTLTELCYYIVGIIITVCAFYCYIHYLLFQKIDYHDNNADVILSLTNLVIDNKKKVLEKYLSNDDIKEVVDRTVKENNLEKKDENNRERDNKNKKKKIKKHQ